MGVDFGVTTGLALLDLQGNILAVMSKRSFSQSDVIKYLETVGEPLVFATDRERPSRKFERIASAFNARLFAPDRDLRVRDKEALLKDTGMEHLNSHEKDALASALNAYTAFEELFRRIDAKLKKRGLSGKGDVVKSKILRDETHNIDKAIKSI